MEPFGAEDHLAASMVAALGSKRSRDEDSPDAAGGFHPEKIARLEQQQQGEADYGAMMAGPPLPPAEQPGLDVAAAAANEAAINADLKPYPFFLYNDFSSEKDPDPLTPLTPPGRVPNFPAKMHSILSRPDLADIICWMPHGRSWRVLKPREFEVKVIPTYFEHAKFSSFIRQANGWGFRRITQGRDRNSYYHELFLRGLPHLCKKMKRPGVSQKQAADPEREPDLYKISEMHPVPVKCDDESILLQCTLQGGPKARMPIYTGLLSSSSSSGSFKPPAIPGLPTAATAASSAAPHHHHQLTPRDQEALNAFQQSLGASENQFRNLALTSSATTSTASAPGAASLLSHQQVVLPPSTFATAPSGGQPHLMHFHNPLTTNNTNNTDPTKALASPNPLATANQLAFAANPNMAAAFSATSAASQFAAGFAAATALTQQQFKQMLDSFAAGFQQQQQPSAVLPPPPTVAPSPQPPQPPPPTM